MADDQQAVARWQAYGLTGVTTASEPDRLPLALHGRAGYDPRMSRPQRLLQLLQVLRRHRRPVSGQLLAAETGVSIRTLYRDIASLQAQGAAIDGAPGMGYVMQPNFLLPPLMFSSEELDALVLGMR
ncbi:MAG: Bifunctional ligase/repressor BirA [Stenotrophomonas maltophilia]|uniref:Bifunctional ligase/repressor BirA n=1 Tax=Stenotrophomonas maltophilia TaxID=40324 RepID=A0A7V8FIE1_STEMA|nr:MAG: Bifunctional ligase/repressor BirA [Stenotrophomonas maltophilia]